MPTVNSDAAVRRRVVAAPGKHTFGIFAEPTRRRAEGFARWAVTPTIEKRRWRKKRNAEQFPNQEIDKGPKSPSKNVEGEIDS